MRRSVWVLLALTPLAAVAQDEPLVCEPVPRVDVARELRQLSLDLLGRPPTVEEYRAAIAKGSVSPEDVRAMMNDERFYERMRNYHRALLLSNVAQSVYRSFDGLFALRGTGASGSPLANTGATGNNTRGRRGVSCDPEIAQASCAAAPMEDPHRDPASRTCYDPDGVPLPVTSDYDADFYDCTTLTGATSCTQAVSSGLEQDTYLNFCDHQRTSSGGTLVRACRPKASTGLDVKVVDGGGRVIAFTNAAATGRFDFCTLTPTYRSGVIGMYAVQPGCVQREGYEVRPKPYWDTSAGATVHVCAYEAQDRTVNPVTGLSCDGTRFITDRSCGCGPGFGRCEPNDRSVFDARVAAVNEEPLWIADSVVRRDEPYFNVLTTRRSFVNGPLATYFKRGQFSRAFPISPPTAPEELPDVSFSDADTWQEYVRDEHHSGVLTTPSFLLRHPTARARVKEFYEAFLCQPFQPAVGASLPPADDACNRENNLAKRCGCSYCHVTLEPVGAHWGRFGERSARFLDPVEFPSEDPRCRDCALSGNTSCGGNCAEYVMRATDGDGASSLGMLKSYLYRSPEEQVNIEEGPSLLATRMMQTGLLEQCTVKRIWQEFLGRPMTGPEQALYLEPLTEGFVRDGRRLKALIERVLATDAYRRID